MSEIKLTLTAVENGVTVERMSTDTNNFIVTTTFVFNELSEMFKFITEDFRPHFEIKQLEIDNEK